MRRSAYVLLALIWIAGIWIWFHRSPDALPPKPLESGARAEDRDARTKTALESVPIPHIPVAPRHRQRIASSPSTTSPALVRVRSSVGLPLLDVEVSVAGEGWERAPLPQSGLEVEPDAYPLRIRAAGHLATDAARGASEVVLEPDALLTVESAHIRNWAKGLSTLLGEGWWTSDAEPQAVFDVRNAGIMAEFSDSDHLQVAYSPSVLASLFSGDVDVNFLRSDGCPIEIALRPIPGLRASWVVPPAGADATAPLDVEIADEGERPSSIRMWLTDLGVPEGNESHLDFPWGSVSIGRPAPPSFPDPIWGRPSRTRLDALRLGRSYALCAMDSNEHYGRTDFVHDGSERRIVLQEPRTVVGRVLDAESGVGLDRPDVHGASAADPNAQEWQSCCGPTDEAGHFELHFPGPYWGGRRERPSFDVPERILLLVSAEGHRSAQLEYSWNGDRRVDVGDVVLQKNPRPIVIAQRGFTPRSWGPLEAFTFGDEPAVQWLLRAVVAQGQGNQELELAFEPDDAGRGLRVPCRELVLGQTSSKPFVRVLGSMLFTSSHGEAFAFRRDEDGLYRELPRSERQVVVECGELPRDGGVWTLGWGGGGTWAAFQKVTAKGFVMKWLVLPDMATELWWSAGEAPIGLCKRAGGSVRLEGYAGPLVLR